MRGWVAAIAAIVTALALAPAHAQERKARIAIGTGNQGGVYFPLGRAIASVITRYVPGAVASAAETGGSIANVQMIEAGRAQMGFAMADSAWDAYHGLDRFDGHAVALRTLAVFYPNRMHVVTLEGTGVTRFADLKGRRVSTGAAGSGTELMALRLLEAEGLDPKRDVVRSQLGLAESVAALRRGAIDALFWVGGVPTPLLADLARGGRRMRLIDHGEAVERLRARFGPIYVASHFSANAYPDQRVESSNVDVWNLLVVPATADETLVYEMTRALFEHRDELAEAYRDAALLELANQSANASPIPYHPGALRYLRERGVRF
jgi:TRAP transporter TAXI family solute receptor